MRGRVLASVGLLLVVLTGCSGGDVGGPGASCEGIYREGATTTEAMTRVDCTFSSGSMQFGTSIEVCADHRTLAHNQLGWGFVGGPWHRSRQKGAMPPDEVLHACREAS